MITNRTARKDLRRRRRLLLEKLEHRLPLAIGTPVFAGGILTFDSVGGNDTLVLSSTDDPNRIQFDGGSSPSRGVVDNVTQVIFNGDGGDDSLVVRNDLGSSVFQPEILFDGGGGDDTVVVNGSSGPDTFRAIDDGQIFFNHQDSVGDDMAIAITSVESRTLNGVGSVDSFLVTAADGPLITVNAANSSSVLNYRSQNAGPIEIRDSRIDDTSGDVVFSGFGEVALNARGQAVSVVGTDDDELIEVDSLGPTDAIVHVSQQPIIRVTSLAPNQLTIDGGGGQDDLTIQSGSISDEISVTDSEVSITAATNVLTINHETLAVLGGAGSDRFTVT
ncbi:MAG: hypothetical protein WBD31_28265, partial [Rubripirellula sp.]